jgi:regulator of replication initiation timing
MEIIPNGKKKTRTAASAEYAALRGIGISEVENDAKEKRITTLHQKGKTVIDVDASEKRRERKVEEPEGPSREVLLHTLLVKAEESARKNEMSRKKWQLLCLGLLVLFIGALFTAISVYVDADAKSWDQSRLYTANYTLKEQLESANTRVIELSRQVGQLENQNAQLGVENSSLRAQKVSLSNTVQPAKAATESGKTEYAEVRTAAVEKKQGSTQKASRERGRLASIAKGEYPQDMTKKELVASLGEPDRVYMGRGYEQLVYFNRSPCRFWFKNGPFYSVSE